MLVDKNAGENSVSFLEDGGRVSGQASGRQDLLLRACNTAERVSGMGYRSRNRRQVHLDFATLQGATKGTVATT